MQRTEQPAMFYGAKRSIFQNAEVLRKDMTVAEKKLWDRLNKSQLGVRFKAQHPIDIFIADFYCHKFKLIIELDGDYHNQEEQKQKDEVRTEVLRLNDLKIIRFKNEEVEQDINQVLTTIKNKIEQLKEK